MLTNSAQPLPARRSVRGLIYTNKLHVALCAGSGALFWSSLAGLGLAPHQMVVVVLVIFAVYQLNRLSDVEEDRRNCPEDLEDALSHRRSITWLACGCGLAAGTLALWIDGWLVIPLGLVALALAILYSGGIGELPLLPKVKRVPGLKNLVPAGCWTAASVLYPALASLHWSTDIALAAGLMFSGSVAVEVLWDVRDLPGDRDSGISTIPAIIGIPRTRALLIALLGGIGAVLMGFALAGTTAFSLALAPLAVLLVFTARLPKIVTRRAYDDLVLALAASLSLGWFIIFYLDLI